MTAGKEQSASVTSSALYQVLTHLMDEGKLIPGKETYQNFHRLYVGTDGCASQFKCGEAIAHYRAMMRDPRFRGVKFYEHLYGGTAHFKGRHDSEGGALKMAITMVVRQQDVDEADSSSFLLRTPQDLVDYANKNLTTPSRQKATSTAHRNRASVTQRTCLLSQPAFAPLETPPKAQGIAAMHRVVYSTDPTIPARWSELSCSCEQCILGDYEDCKMGDNMPQLVPVVLKNDVPHETTLSLAYGKGVGQPLTDTERLIQTLTRMRGPWAAITVKRPAAMHGNSITIADMKVALHFLGIPYMGRSMPKTLPEWIKYTQERLDHVIQEADRRAAAALAGPRDSGYRIRPAQGS